ncbi:MAG: murein hydrolase activator EnvC family protein [Peptostreptococcaceae bacterium]
MKKIIATLIVCSMLFNSNFTYANNKDSLDKKLNENKQEQQTLDNQIKELDIEVNEIEENIQKTNEEIVKLDYEIEQTNLDISRLENDIIKNEELLGKRLKVINNNYSIGYLKVILSSTSLSNFFDNVYMVKQVVEQDKELLRGLDENKIEIQEKENELKNKKKYQQELVVSLEQDNENIKVSKEELESLKRELEKEEEILENEIEKLAMQSIVDVENISASGVISSGSWPVPGYSVNSPYGYRNHPVLNRPKMHTGVDIAAPTGTPAVAIDNGKVIFSGNKGGYGKTLMIQHDDGKVTLYAHNSQLLVSNGDRVQKGQAVTQIGSTGMSTGPHLHFEVRINGNHTNPMPYIK